MKLMYEYVTDLCRVPLECWYEWEGAEPAVIDEGVVVYPDIQELVCLVEVWVNGADVFELISDDLKDVIEVVIRQDRYK